MRSADGETLQEAGRKKKQERRGSLRGSAKWRRVAMPTLEEWLTKTYGSDLSKVTEIKDVPSSVTGKFFFLLADQSAIRILRNVPDHAFCAVCMPATQSHHARTGNVQVLENYPNVTSLNFKGCYKIEGEQTSNENS